MPLSDEQLQALLGMSDIGGKEDELERQTALANQLRNKAVAIQGGGTGGNIGRAAYGVAGAVSDYRASKMPAQISAGKQSLLASLLRKKQMAGGAAPVTGADENGMLPQE